LRDFATEKEAEEYANYQKHVTPMNEGWCFVWKEVKQ